MKKMELISLHLDNFKGLTDFTLMLDGQDIAVYGKNATGKTTLFDAYVYLLFGKDSQNKTNFEIKTLNQDGDIRQHDIDHGVTGLFRIGDDEVELKRVYREKWTKRRGAFEKELTGHTTLYYINGTKKKKSEYEDFIASIVSENVFKLITNPVYFNEFMDAKDRREILIHISGGVDDSEISEGNDELEEFMKRLDGERIDDYIAKLNERRKEVEKEKDGIDIRVDELNLSLEGADGNRDELQAEIINRDKTISEWHEKMESIKSGGEIANKRKRLSELEYESTKIKNDKKIGGMENVYQLKASIQEGEGNIRIFDLNIENNNRLIKQQSDRLKSYEDDIDELRNQWRIKKKEIFEHKADCECPTCGQELPEEQIESARQKAKDDFNYKKSESLENIQKKAAAKSKEADTVKESIDKLKQSNDDTKKQISQLKAKITKQKSELDHMESQEKDIEKDASYQAIMDDYRDVESEIESLQEKAKESFSDIEAEIKKETYMKAQAQDKLNQIAQTEKTKARIDELKNKEKELAKEHESISYKLYLADEFTRKKAEILESKINEKFKRTTFKLFERQMNGSISEVCKATYKGIPYSDGLNNADKTNTGLDIINTLSEFYGIAVPIFIDNAESINRLIETQAQMIQLIVSDKDVLQVDIDNNQKSA